MIINALILIGIYIAVFCIFSIKHKQKGAFVIFILLVVAAVLLGGNTSNPDYAPYQYTYIYGRKNSIEILYSAWIEFGKFLGFDFQVFRLVTYCLALLLQYIAVSRLAVKSLPFWVLYFVFPMMLDGTQTRNYLAMVIILNAITVLIDRKRGFNLKFCLLVVIACGFQLLSAVFLLLILIPYIENSRYLRRIIVIVIIISVFFALNRPAINSLLSFAIIQFGEVDSRIAKYGIIQTRYGFLFSWLYHLIIFAISAYIRRMIIKRPAVSPYITRLIEFGYWLSIISILYFPFYVLVSTFDRIYRTILVYECIIWTTVIQYQEKATSRKKHLIIKKDVALIYSVVLAFCVYLFFMKIYLLYHETIVYTFFHNNWILQTIF